MPSPKARYERLDAEYQHLLRERIELIDRHRAELGSFDSHMADIQDRRKAAYEQLSAFQKVEDDATPDE